MKVLFILLLLLIIVAALALFLKIRFCAYISLDRTKIYIKLGFVKIPLYPAYKKNNENKKTASDENVSGGIVSFKEIWEDGADSLKTSLVRLKNRILIENFYFEYKCGFSDAATTAVMYGIVNGLYYNIFAYLDRNFKIKNMRGDIVPDFGADKKHIALDAVLRLTLADIIYIAAGLLPLIKKLKKNSKKGGALNG